MSRHCVGPSYMNYMKLEFVVNTKACKAQLLRHAANSDLCDFNFNCVSHCNENDKYYKTTTITRLKFMSNDIAYNCFEFEFFFLLILNSFSSF